MVVTGFSDWFCVGVVGLVSWAVALVPHARLKSRNSETISAFSGDILIRNTSVNKVYVPYINTFNMSSDF